MVFVRPNVNNVSRVYDPNLHMENPHKNNDNDDDDSELKKKEMEKNDKDFESNENKLGNDIATKRNAMMYSNESIGSIKVQNVGDYPFVDTDNYKKYLGLKQKTDFISLMAEQLFWIAYIVLVGYFVYVEIKQFLSQMNPTMEETTNPNWGMILSPIIIYTIYKSFQAYSFSKNIF